MGASDLNIPAMTPPEVHTYLREIGSEWTGRGCAVELGSWLGASAVALLQGLTQAGYDQPFWAFDRWTADQKQVKKAARLGQGLTPGEGLMDLFIRNTTAVYRDVTAIPGRIPKSLEKYSGNPIEFCILDAPKRNPVFINSMRILEPYFIPGVTIVGFLDYYAYRKHERQQAYNLMAPVIFVENNMESFTFMKDWEGICSCAFFRYQKPVSWNGRK